MSLEAIVFYTDGSSLTIDNSVDAKHLATMLKASTRTVLKPVHFGNLNNALQEMTFNLLNHDAEDDDSYRLYVVNTELDAADVQRNLKDLNAHLRKTDDDFKSNDTELDFKLLMRVMGVESLLNRVVKTPAIIDFG